MCATGAVLNVGEARLRRRKFSAVHRGGYCGFDNVSVCIKSKTVCKRRRSFVNDRVTRPADGFKRRLRAACVPLLPQMKPGLYVFIARQPAAEAAFDKLSRSMQYLLRRQNLLLPDAQKKPRPAEKAADCP